MSSALIFIAVHVFEEWKNEGNGGNSNSITNKNIVERWLRPCPAAVAVRFNE